MPIAENIDGQIGKRPDQPRVRRCAGTKPDEFPLPVRTMKGVRPCRSGPRRAGPRDQARRCRARRFATAWRPPDGVGIGEATHEAGARRRADPLIVLDGGHLARHRIGGDPDFGIAGLPFREGTPPMVRVRSAAAGSRRRARPRSCKARARSAASRGGRVPMQRQRSRVARADPPPLGQFRLGHVARGVGEGVGAGARHHAASARCGRIIIAGIVALRRGL